MSDIQRTIEAMKEWERCPDGTVMYKGLSRWVKGEKFPDSFAVGIKYTFAYPDGWIKHEGGECPINGATIVEILEMDGTYTISRADRFYWIWRGHPGDITHYRIIEEAKPEKVKVVWHQSSGGGIWASVEGSDICKTRDEHDDRTRVEIEL